MKKCRLTTIVLIAFLTQTFCAGAQPTSPRNETQDWKAVIKIVENTRDSLRAAQDSLSVYAKTDATQRARLDSLHQGIRLLQQSERGYQEALLAYDRRLQLADERKRTAEEWYRKSKRDGRRSSVRSFFKGLLMGAAVVGGLVIF